MDFEKNSILKNFIEISWLLHMFLQTCTFEAKFVFAEIDVTFKRSSIGAAGYRGLPPIYRRCNAGLLRATASYRRLLPATAS